MYTHEVKLTVTDTHTTVVQTQTCKGTLMVMLGNVGLRGGVQRTRKGNHITASAISNILLSLLHINETLSKQA